MVAEQHATNTRLKNLRILEMELTVATKLIEKGVDHRTTPQVWADLGAGRGTFTNALAALLPEESTVYAVDKDAASLNSIRLTSARVKLIKSINDFINTYTLPKNLDGVLMANALHFVDKKIDFINLLRKNLKASA